MQVLAQAAWTPTAAAPRPAPALLAANERRRAPQAVLMALQAAEAAGAGAAVDLGSVATVFASAHGDLAIVDALCRTLADEPLLLSPLRFHHSVHNAASGYFAIGARNREASTAVAAGPWSFGAGWLEAAGQCAAEQRPVLLVGCDTAAPDGPLQSVNDSREALAVALLLAPPGAGGRGVRWQLQPGRFTPPPGNPMAAARPLLAALGAAPAARLDVPLSAQLGLVIDVEAEGDRESGPA
ncbi:MAG: beta-ketoacyl synthase chain length factor [Proteobacteria bacterium]|nr:beta-ketoacyl synthase chain length factor [Pseudomonadota bacterium]